jgi:hypothetical protein
VIRTPGSPHPQALTTLRVRTSSPSENVARDHQGFSPPRTGRGGWRLEWLFGSPVAGEFADANSFVGVGLLTAALKREP